jgi:D-amino-acid oxidase
LTTSEGALQPVNCSDARIVATVAGLRPFRPQGFRVERQLLGGKTIVHNYGHGGCGVTLSWGTSWKAVELACESAPRHVAVLGAGAVGLATARLLQERGVGVRIYARDVTPHTTSDVAGALWSPVTLVDDGRQPASFRQTLREAATASRRRFERITDGDHGVRWVTFYLIGESAQPPSSWEWDATPEYFRPVTLRSGLHPFPTLHAHRYRTMLIEPAIYLPELMRDVVSSGGQVVLGEIPTLEALLRLEEDVVVNCTGLGARALFADDSLVPIKGQLTILQPQPQVDYAVKSTDEDLYMFPRKGGIVLGGSHQRGERSLEPDPAEAARILRQHQRLFGRMGG